MSTNDFDTFAKKTIESFRVQPSQITRDRSLELKREKIREQQVRVKMAIDRLTSPRKNNKFCPCCSNYYLDEKDLNQHLNHRQNQSFQNRPRDNIKIQPHSSLHNSSSYLNANPASQILRVNGEMGGIREINDFAIK